MAGSLHGLNTDGLIIPPAPLPPSGIPPPHICISTGSTIDLTNNGLDYPSLTLNNGLIDVLSINDGLQNGGHIMDDRLKVVNDVGNDNHIDDDDDDEELDEEEEEEEEADEDDNDEDSCLVDDIDSNDTVHHHLHHHHHLHPHNHTFHHTTTTHNDLQPEIFINDIRFDGDDMQHLAQLKSSV